MGASTTSLKNIKDTVDRFFVNISVGMPNENCTGLRLAQKLSYHETNADADNRMLVDGINVFPKHQIISLEKTQVRQRAAINITSTKVDLTVTARCSRRRQHACTQTRARTRTHTWEETAKSRVNRDLYSLHETRKNGGELSGCAMDITWPCENVRR